MIRSAHDKNSVEQSLQPLRDRNCELKRKNIELAEENLKLQDENLILKKTRWGSEELLNATIHKLEKKLADAKSKPKSLGKTLAWFRNNMFGLKSEKNDVNQDAELEAEVIELEEQSQPKRNNGQQPGAKGHGNKDLSDVPVSQVIPVKISDCRCSECGTLYRTLSAVEKSPSFLS